MGFRGSKGNCIAQEAIQRNLVPTRNFERTHMVDHGERVQFVQTGDDARIFYVGQTTDVYCEVRACMDTREGEGGPLDVPVCQPETFADLAESESRIHVRCYKLSYHDVNYSELAYLRKTVSFSFTCFKLEQFLGEGQAFCSVAKSVCRFRGCSRLFQLGSELIGNLLF